MIPNKPRCSTCGRFLGNKNYTGQRWMVGRTTNPLGVYRCSGGHQTVLTMPWDFLSKRTH